MINIALLGCGRIGQVHANSLLGIDGARVAAVCDAVPAAADALAERTGAKVMDTDAILADADIDAVVIGTPTTTHYDLKWSGKFGQRAKMYPTRTNGYENDKATELFRQV